MNTNLSKRFSRPLFALAVSFLTIGGVSAPAFAAESGSTTFTVTAVGKKNTVPPELKKDDVQLHNGKERLQIADWRREDTLRLAILIDDSLDPTVAGQWNDLKDFIMAQPQTTYIAVAYARNGAAAIAQDFTTNHELAAKAIRIPMGSAGAISSPYLAVLDYIKRWPSPGGRNSILFISAGIDYFRGGFGLQNPDVDSAISRAEKANINIWTVYSPDNFHRGRGFFRVNNAQSLLSKLSEETGAESYFLGIGAPVNLKPYFEEIDQHLKNQYLLSFRGDGGKKGKFQHIRVRTEQPEVEFLTFDEVFLPPTQQ
jgi:VWFA-related protein